MILELVSFAIGTIAWFILLIERLVSGKKGITTFQGTNVVLPISAPYLYFPGAFIQAALFWTYCVFPVIYLFKHLSKRRPLPNSNRKHV